MMALLNFFSSQRLQEKDYFDLFGALPHDIRISLTLLWATIQRPWFEYRFFKDYSKFPLLDQNSFLEVYLLWRPTRVHAFKSFVFHWAESKKNFSLLRNFIADYHTLTSISEVCCGSFYLELFPHLCGALWRCERTYFKSTFENGAKHNNAILRRREKDVKR